jgi:hypothetical protein
MCSAEQGLHKITWTLIRIKMLTLYNNYQT